ncbi:MMPL family transporter [Stackebrandtia nassauensis]|uniref:MMPL domain protein n=1 Tax=Stackebrandtia nassauensis (strain DSM 44728 / CIP 108903 / NRRL B-16338 / NBRC 102104 / LLR-40K-21) TaxID=446470 RepID=D3PWT1_STANL|nr:MMPL family transporter [Stackebrandtia nassauensis]ADD43303.1 MMPL domain protein [Stackebrandtia nassauensis DSM 44728]
MSTVLYRLGRNGARRPFLTLAITAAVVAVIGFVSAGLGGAPHNTVDLPGTSSHAATQLLEQRFPDEAGARAHIAADWGEADVDENALDDTVARLEQRDGVREVAVRRSDSANIAIVAVSYHRPATELSATAETDALDRAATPLRDSADAVAVGGELPESVQGPDGTAEAVGVGVALLILLYAFGLLLAAGFPLLIAGLGVGTGMGLIMLIAGFTTVNTATPTLGAMIGLGVGIDYALFIVSRYRAHRHAGNDSVASAAVATATAGHSVVIAGATVLVGLTGLALCGVPSFTTMGLAAGLVVIVEVLLSITVLPALLGRFGHRMRRSRRDPEQPARWAATLSATVTRRPTAWLLTALVLLTVLAVPVTGMRLGQNDAGAEAADSTTRRAFDIVAEGFGPGATGPLLIVVDTRRTGTAAVADIRDRVAGLTGVERLTPSRKSDDGTVTVFEAVGSQRPQSPETERLVREVTRTLPDGAELTGPTAINMDMSGRLADRLWLVIAVVLVLSFVLLVFMLRSLLIPLKAVLMNLLSVTASFGVLTLAFQTHAGARLLGLDDPVPIAGWAPLVLFAILFGLSMDYEIFLLGRIREAYLVSGDNTAAVVSGLSQAARLITATAAIMVAVALGFAFDSSVMVKIIGVGMATALLLDATVVRMVLVPATMTLLGRANWYLPRWLGRHPSQPGAAELERKFGEADARPRLRQLRVPVAAVA